MQVRVFLKLLKNACTGNALCVKRKHFGHLYLLVVSKFYQWKTKTEEREIQTADGTHKISVHIAVMEKENITLETLLDEKSVLQTKRL